MGGGGRDLWNIPHTGIDDEDLDTKIKKATAKLAKQAERIEELPEDKTSIFISHQNRDKEKTQRAHQYAEYLKEKTEFEVNIDKEFFPKEQITNLAKINEIISKVMRESDIFIALYHPVKESNRFERSLWYDLEAKKARFWGKPIIHVFLDGSRDSGVVTGTKCYKIHYKKGDHWKADLVEQIKEIANNHKVKD